jgi:hypothetical protein
MQRRGRAYSLPLFEGWRSGECVSHIPQSLSNPKHISGGKKLSFWALAATHAIDLQKALYVFPIFRVFLKEIKILQDADSVMSMKKFLRKI